MALPAVQNLKDYLRVETTAEDTVLTAILARAGAAVRTYLDRPIEAVEKTYRIEGDSQRAYGQITKLIVPDAPLSLAAGKEPEVVDGDGNTVDPTMYMVNPETGVLRAVAGEVFAAFPYDVTATVGLATADDYAARIEPLIGACILDYAAELYQHRNPGAAQESTLGVSVSYGGSGLPPRLQVALMALRRVGIA
jgi:hypothetical protein